MKYGAQIAENERGMDRKNQYRGFPGIRGNFGAMLSGLLLFAAFPPLECPLLAWIALVPLLCAGFRSGPVCAFKIGFLAGFLFWLLSVFWLTRVSWAGWLLLSAYCALFTASFAACAAWFYGRSLCRKRGGGVFALIFIPAIWVGFEFLRYGLFSGFPWNSLGVSQYANIEFIQAASVGGVHLVSYIVAMVNTAFALALAGYVNRPFSRPSLEVLFELCMAVLVTVFAMLSGRGILSRLPTANASIKIAAVQANIPQVEKWSESFSSVVGERLRSASADAIVGHRPDIVIWPETAVPDFVRVDGPSRDIVDEIVRLGTPLLMGSMDYDNSGTEINYFNSAFLFRSADLPPQVYAKRHLVLFGEYIPLERLIPFLKALTPMETSFTAGREAVVFRLGEWAFSVLICFEDSVAGLARDCVRAGARLLINQTNDAWFDPLWGSRQHMAQCVFRCVENRIDVVRVTNTGVTCHIDRSGAIVSRLEPDAAGWRAPQVMICEAGLSPESIPMTFYTRYGDLFGWLCAAVSILSSAGAFLRSRRKCF